MPMMGALAVSMMCLNSAALRMASDFCLFNSVMSWPTPTTPLTLPSAPRLGVAFSRMSCFSPLLEYSSNSKLPTTSPPRAVSSTSSTRVLCSASMNSAAKGRPRVSWRVKPLIIATFRFHSLTQPFTSRPKIGAFAVSINLDRSSATSCDSRITARSSVMSWPTPMTPLTMPSAPRRVVAFSRRFRRVPSLVNSGNSKLEDSLPSKAICSTCPTSSR
mmetsp:Transcript_75074/g.207082  ORF Transcript_75074/g.207082 Transcript_75074/m.207082 type:complete len:217 (-) Transcript_75074:605-1255(-)